MSTHPPKRRYRLLEHLPAPQTMPDSNVEEAKSVLSDIDVAVQRMVDCCAADDFRRGVRETARSIEDWIDEHQYCTEKQLAALKNMCNGCERWLTPKKTHNFAYDDGDDDWDDE